MCFMLHVFRPLSLPWPVLLSLHLSNTCTHVNIQHTDTPEARQRVQVDGCVWLVQAMIGINCHGRRHACLSHEVNSDWPDESRSCFWRSWSPRASCALPVLNSPHLSTLHPSDPLMARWRRDTSGHHVFAGVCRISDAVRWFPLRPPCALCLPSAISLIVRRLLERKTSFPVLFGAVVCVMWIFYHLIFFCYSWKMKVWLSWIRICLFIWLLLQFMLESSRWTGSLVRMNKPVWGELSNPRVLKFKKSHFWSW